MDKDTALKLALEALDAALSDNQPYIDKSKKAITAIKQARSAPVQERNFCERCGKRLGSGIHTCTPPAAPMQEPVEFFDWYDNAHWGNEDFKEGCHRSWNAAIKYTTPPAAQRQWVGLTDEEIAMAWPYELGQLEKQFAFNLEAKLRSKNT
jgi:hypothetical protein